MFSIELPVFLWSAVFTLISLYLILDSRRLGTFILSAFMPRERSLLLSEVKKTKGIELLPFLGSVVFLIVFPDAVYSLVALIGIPLLLGTACLIIRVILEQFSSDTTQGKLYWFLFILCLILIFIKAWILGLYITLFSYHCSFLITLISGAITALICLASGASSILAQTNNIRKWSSVYILIMAITLALYPVLYQIVLLDWPWLAGRWINFWDLYWLWPAPLMIISSLLILIWQFIKKHWTYVQYAHDLFMVGIFYALGASIWPYIVPPSLTIWDVQNSDPIEFLAVILILFAFPLLILLIVHLNHGDE